MTDTNDAGDSTGTRTPASSGAPPGKGCGRWLLGCLVVPLVVLLVLVLVMTLVSRVRSGHIVFSPEVNSGTVWAAEGTPGRTVGGWHTADVMVYGSEGGLVGLSTGSGEELWRLEPEGSVCGMSEEAPDGFGVVLLEGDVDAADVPGVDDERLRVLRGDGPVLSCDVALVVDTDTGAELWRTDPLADGDSAEADLLFSLDTDAEAVGDQVLVRTGGELVGLDGGSGSELWRHGAFARSGEGCPATDFLARGDAEVVVALDCGIDGSVHVHVVDPATGRDTGAFEFPRGRSQPNMESVGRTRLVATDPIHVRVDLGHSSGVGEGYDPDVDGPRESRTATVAFDDDGDVLHRIGVHDLFRGTGSREEGLFVVEGDRLYATTDHNSCGNEVSAHDLRTGEQLWENRISDPGLDLVGVRDGRLLVMLDGNGSFGECSMFGPAWAWQLYTVDTATGEAEPLTTPLSGRRQPRATDLWWGEDRMFQIEPSHGDGTGRVTAFG